MLLHIRSLAGYTIDMLESSFWKRQGFAFADVGDGDNAAHIFALTNPINHATSRSDADRFRVEPYVIGADVASVAPHTGRGGWTWYTGSAAWTWRLGVEAILGLQLRNGELLIDPVLPKRWGSFEAEIKGPAGALEIRVEDPDHIGRGVGIQEAEGYHQLDERHRSYAPKYNST
jgi:cyclic beta-1,2-glucan synthetase